MTSPHLHPSWPCPCFYQWEQPSRLSQSGLQEDPLGKGNEEQFNFRSLRGSTQTCRDSVLLGHLQFLCFPHGGAMVLISSLYLSIASARCEHFQEIRFQTLLVSPCECFGLTLDNFKSPDVLWNTYFDWLSVLRFRWRPEWSPSHTEVMAAAYLVTWNINMSKLNFSCQW